MYLWDSAWWWAFVIAQVGLVAFGYGVGKEKNRPIAGVVLPALYSVFGLVALACLPDGKPLFPEPSISNRAAEKANEHLHRIAELLEEIKARGIDA